jgi:hypothetical protein
METLAGILHVQASSLYLIDETTGKLVIQAATGYQTPLVEAHATYHLGEGVTGWIAQQGEWIRANSTDELHRTPGWLGKQNQRQGGREPYSFLGLPLKIMDLSAGRERVIGVLKIEDIVPSPDHPEPYFTDQDIVLVGMMANVIALSINTATAK